MPPPQTASGIAAFFTLVWLLKYGLVLSALLVYLPFTTYPHVPLHGMLGNLFSELAPLSTFSAAVFVFLTAWAVMIVEGLIVNGVEIHFPGGMPRRAYLRRDSPQRPSCTSTSACYSSSGSSGR